MSAQREHRECLRSWRHRLPQLSPDEIAGLSPMRCGDEVEHFPRFVRRAIAGAKASKRPARATATARPRARARSRRDRARRFIAARGAPDSDQPHLAWRGSRLITVSEDYFGLGGVVEAWDGEPE